jgi:hypothetical protein
VFLKKKKEPTGFCKIVTVKINTYHSQIMDDLTKLTQQLQNIPTEEIIPKKSSCENNFSLDIMNILSQIFECIIW